MTVIETLTLALVAWVASFRLFTRVGHSSDKVESLLGHAIALAFENRTTPLQRFAQRNMDPRHIRPRLCPVKRLGQETVEAAGALNDLSVLFLWKQVKSPAFNNRLQILITAEKMAGLCSELLVCFADFPFSQKTRAGVDGIHGRTKRPLCPAKVERDHGIEISERLGFRARSFAAKINC